MVKLNAVVFAVLAVFASFISASSAAADEKHCAPRSCCGCPGNGKSKVKVLMNVFLEKLAECEREDAFQLISTDDASMDYYQSISCNLTERNIESFYNDFFPCGSLFRNTDFEYTMLHGGDIQVTFLAVVVMTNETTKAYEMSYLWTQDYQCNWHIDRISGVDLACLIPA